MWASFHFTPPTILARMQLQGLLDKGNDRPYVVRFVLNELIYFRVDTGTDEEYFKHYYVKPWTRASAYLMGILAGWCLHITRESKTRLSKVYKILILTCCF